MVSERGFPEQRSSFCSPGGPLYPWVRHLPWSTSLSAQLCKWILFKNSGWWGQRRESAKQAATFSAALPQVSLPVLISVPHFSACWAWVRYPYFRFLFLISHSWIIPVTNLSIHFNCFQCWKWLWHTDLLWKVLCCEFCCEVANVSTKYENINGIKYGFIYNVSGKLLGCVKKCYNFDIQQNIYKYSLRL